MTKETMEQLHDYYEQYRVEGFDYQDMQDVIALIFEIYEKELPQGKDKKRINMKNNKTVDEIEEVLKKLYIKNNRKKIQMFNCYAIVPDPYIVLYDKNNVEVRYCSHYDYIEVVGLNEKDYNYLFKKYGDY